MPADPAMIATVEPEGSAFPVDHLGVRRRVRTPLNDEKIALPSEGCSWRSALAAGWAALLRVPLAGAAVLDVALVAGVLGVLLPGVAVLMPALLVLALHAVHRRLVLSGR